MCGFWCSGLDSLPVSAAESFWYGQMKLIAWICSSVPARGKEIDMGRHSGKLKVYYDGACPECIKDRKRYQQLAGRGNESVEWIDIPAGTKNSSGRASTPGRLSVSCM